MVVELYEEEVYGEEPVMCVAARQGGERIQCQRER